MSAAAVSATIANPNRRPRVVAWPLRLPPELEARTWREIRAFEEAQQVTYVTYGERIGLTQGLHEGISALLIG